MGTRVANTRMPSFRQMEQGADLLSAMSPAEVTEKLGLHKMKERSWYVHPR